MTQAEDNYTNVYINNIDYKITGSELKELCERAVGAEGCVTSAVVFKAHNRNATAYGFCNFSSHEYAKAAIDRINSSNYYIINSKKISASRAIDKDHRSMYKQQLYGNDPDKNVNLYIKGFELSIDEEGLRKAFEPYGAITNVRIIRDTNGFSRGFGFVSFQNHDDAQRAIECMDGKTLDHRTISVMFYTPKSSRDASPVESEQTSPVLSSTTPSPQMNSLPIITATLIDNSSSSSNNNNNNIMTAEKTQFSMNFTPFRKVSVERNETFPKIARNNECEHGIYINGLRFVTDEKEVQQYFYDFDLAGVEKVLNHRKIFTGTWKVLFKTECETKRALDICKYLTVRNRPVHAVPLTQSPTLYCA